MSLITYTKIRNRDHVTQSLLSSLCVLVLYLVMANFIVAQAEHQGGYSQPFNVAEEKFVTHALLRFHHSDMVVRTSDRRSKTSYYRGRKGLIYGGKDHKQFLGCIGCGTFSSNSICNRHGSYGSKYSRNSLFNEHSNFGSKYSRSSPWNLYNSSDSTPILVDDRGRFFGYFTSNPYRSQAFSYARDLQRWYNDADGDLEAFQDKLCAVLG